MGARDGLYGAFVFGAGLCLALLLSAPGAAEGQAQDGFRYVPEGEVVEGPAYVADSATFVRLLERLEQARADSIARRMLEQDTLLMRQTIDGWKERLALCEQKYESLQGVVDAERDVRETLEEMQPSGLEGFLFQGPSGFVTGNVTGLALGVLSCRASGG